MKLMKHDIIGHTRTSHELLRFVGLQFAFEQYCDVIKGIDEFWFKMSCDNGVLFLYIDFFFDR